MSGEGFLNKGVTATKTQQENISTESEDFFDSKIFRLITLGLYMGGVSGLGFTLAMYYIFLWDSSMPEVPIILKH